ncbi:ISAs1 family transposase [Pontibaca salina]|uniref:ISAs1 family transposase n=1 Tax=Pontibaca salina TaxID=2795731 RepID=UPI002FCDDB2A
MAAFGRAKKHLFRDFLKLKHAIPSHDTFSDVFRMIDPKALDAAFGRVLADVAALLKDGDVIAIDGKALRGARDKTENARTRMMVSAYAARLRFTLATVPADQRIDHANTKLTCHSRTPPCLKQAAHRRAEAIAETQTRLGDQGSA